MGAAEPELRGRVRNATSGDIGELQRLDEAARGHLHAQRGGGEHLRSAVRSQPAGPSLSDQLADPDSLVLIAEVGDAAVGYAAAELRRHGDGAATASVSELFVEQDLRGVGIGHALMTQLTDWAVQQGATGIEATAMPGDRETKNFFESFGLVARALVVYRDLR